MSRSGSLFAIVLAAVLCTSVSAQDKIHYKDGQIYPNEASTQEIKVTEETYEVVRYELSSRGVKLEQDVSASKVDYIVYGRKHREFGAAKDLFDTGDFESAVELFQPLSSKTSPHYIKQYTLFHIAECHFAMGAWNDAIVAYGVLEREVPKSRFLPEAHLRTGIAYLNLKKITDARNVFSKLKRDVTGKGFDPEFEHRAELGLIAIDEAEGKYSVALAALEKLQSKVGEDYPEVASECRLRIGNVYIREGDFRKAENYFQAILDAGTTDKAVVYGAYNGLGKSYFAQNKFKEALKDCYLRVVVMDDQAGDVPLPILAEALYWSGRCWDQLRGEKPEHGRYARDLYREVIRKAPGSTFANDAKKHIRR